MQIYNILLIKYLSFRESARTGKNEQEPARIGPNRSPLVPIGPNRSQSVPIGPDWPGAPRKLSGGPSVSADARAEGYAALYHIGQNLNITSIAAVRESWSSPNTALLEWSHRNSGRNRRFLRTLSVGQGVRVRPKVFS